MAQSPNRPSSGSKASGGGGRRRTPPPPVKKPFPWGVAAVSTVLAIALIGILVYAVANQGAGFQSALNRADQSIDGLKKVTDASARHVPGAVDYKEEPPAGGDHNSAPQSCQVYDAAIAPEHALHSLEHGAAWVTYAPDLPADQVRKLVDLVQGDPYRMLSPYPGLKGGKISLQAWQRQVFVDSVDDPRVEEFLKAYTNGPQAPERGASCSGNTTTGPVQGAPPAPPVTATIPPPSSAPSASS